MMLLQKLKWILCALILFFGLGSTWGFAQEMPLYEENTLYVKFKDQSEISAKKMLQSKNGEKMVATSLLGFSNNLISRYKIDPEAVSMAFFDNPVLDRTFMISIDPTAKANIEQLMEELQKNPNVEYVERVPFNRIYANPPKVSYDDPFYGKIGAQQQINISWHLDLINAEKAWGLQTGDSNIIVAVVDNAVWGEHEDLQIPGKRQYNAVTKRTGDGQAKPPVSDAIRDQQCDEASIFNGTCTAYEFSHGTHCAGAIAAINNNGKGISSIGSGVSLMGIGGPNVDNPRGVYMSYQGVEWAVSHGAKIISCSWGSDADALTNEAVMKTCYEKGIIVIAAAGNDDINPPHYPAAYTPYVISVGSVDADKRKSSFSNHGYWVDILSPGGSDTGVYKSQIFSTTFCQNQWTRLLGGDNVLQGKYYDEMSGTSMATPVLAGVVGLLVSMDSTLTTDQVRYLLQQTGQAPNPASSNYYNEYCKIVDAYAALNYLKEKPVFGPAIAKTDISATNSHDTVWLEWQIPYSASQPVKAFQIYRKGMLLADTITGHLVYDSTLNEETGEYVINSFIQASFIDTKQNEGTIRYAVAPVFENADLVGLRTEIDILIKTYYTIAASVRPDTTWGHVQGTGEYEKGKMFSLKAVPSEGCEFDRWEDERGTKLYGTMMNGPAAKNRRFFAFFRNPLPSENLEQLNHSIRISPNPASTQVLIQCDGFDILHVRVTDFQGKTFFRTFCQTRELTMDVNSWPNGVYIVQITTQAGTVNQKLIKQ